MIKNIEWLPKFPFQRHTRNLLSLLLLTGCLLAASFNFLSAPPDDTSTLRVNVDLVNILFTVTDEKGRLIPDLPKEAFQVEEDGRRQEISRFSHEITLPLTLALLIDSSPSVESILGLEQQTAMEFFRDVLRTKDLAMVINFDRSVNLLQDFTPQLGLLEKAINSIRIGGGTAIHDAVFLACDEKLKYEAGRKAIILISDGADTVSKLKMKEALEAAQRADAIIFGISDRAGGSFYHAFERDDGTLKKYAEETGGRALFPSKPQDLKKAFDAIQQELRSQYSLAYNPSNTARDGSYRAIKILSTQSKGLKIRARKGYYAPRS
jgi:Ca-activated chloride channel family protein